MAVYSYVGRHQVVDGELQNFRQILGIGGNNVPDVAVNKNFSPVGSG
jgi:hypothetical protein